MLVLSRKKNEAIMIGEIEIIVVEIRGDRIRLGIEADKKVPVHRKEVYDAIKREGGSSVGAVGLLPDDGNAPPIEPHSGSPPA